MYLGSHLSLSYLKEHVARTKVIVYCLDTGRSEEMLWSRLQSE